MPVYLRTTTLLVFIFSTLLISASCCRQGDAGQLKNADKPFTIEAVYSTCGHPIPCQQKAVCEGQRVWVSGRIDYSNVFHKNRYPQLRYEKFFLKSKSGKILPIIVDGGESVKIFNKIEAFKDSGITHISVQGKIKGTDLPIMGKCQQGLSLILNKAHQIRAIR